MLVRVPFGREVLTGYILKISSEPASDSAGKRMRSILGRVDDVPAISADLLALTAWVADRYLAPPGQCLRLVFPGIADRERQPETAFAPAFSPDPTVASDVPPLAPAWAPFRDELLNAVRERRHAALLVPGGTRDLIPLYRELIHTALSRNRSALVLVPEIHQIEALRRLLSNGEQPPEAYHGRLSLADRRRAWNRIQRGEARLVIGTRSATFVPLVDLGIIIIDQEDHTAYKAENAPRYDARVVAAERARRLQAVLVLASAHPSLESVHASGNLGVTSLRSETRTLRPARVINLRDSQGQILAAPLVDAIADRLATRQTALLFLNRKGYASVLLCRDCGNAVRCPTCGLGWTFHKKETVLVCTHCGRREAAPNTCPRCQGTRLFPSGLGTEAAEEAVQRQFPNARLLRLERIPRVRTHTNDELLARLRAKDYDILIATQFVLSLVPRPVASLVGILAADAALHFPDFLAAERAYHTLREVMALAPDDASGAEVMIQTYMPEHYVIRALSTRNPAIFYENELAARAVLAYPPFGRLVSLAVTGTREDAVATAADRWAGLLQMEIRQAAGQPDAPVFQLLGPIPSVPPRRRGRFRRQLIVKGQDGTLLREAVRRTLIIMESDGRAGNVRYVVDVDPVSLL
jgi:primosomal protein N' (replication factor Y)